MHFAQQILYYIPSFPLAIILVFGAAALAVAGLLWVRRHVHHSRLKIHHDVSAAILQTIGTIYAVLIAFVVVITWENFDRSKLNVEKEANCLSDLRKDLFGLSAPLKTQIPSLLDEYAKAVIEDEWHMIEKGEKSPKLDEIVKTIWDLYASYSPKTDTERIFLDKSVDKLNDLNELRKVRIIDSHNGIHSILWFVLAAGGVLTVAFTFFFGIEDLTLHAIMTALLAAIIALILFTILSFDYPFTGEITISPDAFKSEVKCS